ncbi:MAG: flagellar type III secretion system pore protein FliP [Candidatus Hydrogenedentota bacterium]
MGGNVVQSATYILQFTNYLNRICRFKKYFFIILIFLFFFWSRIYGAGEDLNLPLPVPKVNIDITEAKSPEEVSTALQLLFLLTILALAPSIILMTTSFVRVAIILSFIKRALSLQDLPPNQVMMSLALFLTFFIMAPTFLKINNEAIQPYLKGEITQREALSKAMVPLREFMFKQTREKDIALFVKLGNLERPKNMNDIPTYILVPAFMISEIHISFIMGLYLYLPFVVIDMVVASTLLSMGMIMLPPVMISLPFKILLFIVIDGWHLLSYAIVKAYM